MFKGTALIFTMLLAYWLFGEPITTNNTIGVVVWQILSGGGFYLGVLPVVFGCAVGTITFFLVNLIEWKQGVEAAPSAYIGE